MSIVTKGAAGNGCFLRIFARKWRGWVFCNRSEKTVFLERFRTAPHRSKKMVFLERFYCLNHSEKMVFLELAAVFLFMKRQRSRRSWRSGVDYARRSLLELACGSEWCAFA